MLLRSSAALRWRVVRGRSLMASAKRCGLIGRASADMVAIMSLYELGW